jgi:signal transduction histidine kinase/CheY-like chemotaxis protein/methyl-accepting chemotaxis protein
MKLNIRAKLLLSFATILLLSSAVNIYSLVQMEVLADLTTKIYNHPLQVTRAVLSANTDIIKMHRSMKDIVQANNEAEVIAAQTQVKQYEQQVLRHFAIVQKWILGHEGAELIAQTIQIFRDWTPIREQVIALMKTGQTEPAVALTNGKEEKQVDLLDNQMKELTQYAAYKATDMYKQAQATRSRLMTTTIIALITVVILSALLGFLISASFVQSVQIIKTLAGQLVAGEISLTVSHRVQIEKVLAYRDEMGEIGRSFDAVAHSFHSVINDLVQVSQGMAAGNLRVTPKMEYKGDFFQVKQALENSLSDLRQVIDDIVQVSQQIADGEQHVITKPVYQGDFVQIKKALEAASVKLVQATTQNKAQDWLKTGQTQLNEKLTGEQTINQLAKKTIDYLTTYVEASVGVFYLVKDSSSPSVYLQEMASYAYTRSDNSQLQFRLGEGLVGQAALEKKVLFCSHSPEEYTYIIRSGLSQTVSRYVLISPILYEETIKGVIEIGAAHALTDIQKTFLEQAMPSVGIALNLAESRARMQELLEQSQQKTEELQSQSEELRTQQEELQQINQKLQVGRDMLQQKQNELEQRNEELQNQSEELQTQSEELRQTNEELSLRTKELEQQQQALEKSQATAEKARAAIETKAEELELASRYKSEFLANMSHELRTPLNSLLILAQVLADNKPGNLTDEQQEYAKTIHSAGTDLLTLINDILDLSKVEAGKMAMNVEKISLSELIESIEQKFRPLADKKQLAFNISQSDDLPLALWTDGQRLKQILNNLLSNAFKFTSQGEIRLEMWCPSSSELESLSQDKASKQDFLAFSVADTGIGIPADKKQLIFEAFQQVDGGTSRRYGGTGLGLSISRQLAKLLGGELKLHTIEGEGSTFTLYLPNRTEPQPKQSIKKNGDGEFSRLESTPSQTPKPEKTASVTEELDSLMDDRIQLKPDDKTLLIIEDDQKFSRILMKKARENHFKCLLAFDGRTGLTLAAEYQPTAILLDIGLPEIDGWAVLEKLKEHPETRSIPVHFISADDPKTIEATKMGAIGYLQKPVNQEQLTEAFQSLEQFLVKPVKNLLLVADDDTQQQLLELVSGDEIEIQVATTKAAALQKLQKAAFDCIIVDMDIEPASQLLEQMPDELRQTPIITYTKRDLTPAEEVLLQRCADQLPIKSVNSQERLLEEVTRFLHQLETQLSDKQRQMLQKVHDKGAIFRHKKVLIVDDDMRNVFALTTILEEKDMEVVMAENGQEALTQLQQHDEIAIVLMDIMMPGMDGYEAIRQIRQQPRYHQLPIIALTAKAMKGDKAKCISAGANDYLSKPVDVDKLISLMRVWLYR